MKAVSFRSNVLRLGYVYVRIWIAAAIADRITVSIYFGSCIRFLKKINIVN
ncbi:MAG: hypothetical protein WDO19_13565 [Bacteroidota bacterium]